MTEAEQPLQTDPEPKEVSEETARLSKAASAMGRKGGTQTRDKHGTEYYVELGKKGAAKRWGRELVE